jgi:methylthioribose-1-phosphate isomerase
MRPVSPIRPLIPSPDGLTIEVLDQTRLPHESHVLKLSTLDQVAHAIRSMIVRGAPLIGAAAAWGLVFALREDASDQSLKESCASLNATRPTAVNLAWALARMQTCLTPLPVSDRYQAAQKEALAICDEDVAQNYAIGQHGLKILQELYKQKQRPLRLLTHCNAGALATVGWGTALAPMYLAQLAGLPFEVWVDETRPRNQGALTAWELHKAGITHTYVADNAGGHLMQHGLVDCVIVGADRVSAQGDVCNKIGTYLKALAAKESGIPFYAAVPTPTIDWTIQDALKEIPIEERNSDEVTWVQGLTQEGCLESVRVSPLGVQSGNPAFDVTPAHLITGILTERGLYPASLLGLKPLREALNDIHIS